MVRHSLVRGTAGYLGTFDTKKEAEEFLYAYKRQKGFLWELPNENDN